MVRKEYLQYMPVSTDRTADILKTKAVWETLQTVRSAGTTGITAKEISSKTDQSISTVYGAIRTLWRHGFLRRKKRPVEDQSEEAASIPEGFGTGEVSETPRGKIPMEYFEPCDIRSSFEQDPRGEPENPWGDVVFSTNFIKNIANMFDREDDLGELREDAKKSILDFIKKAYKALKDREEERVEEALPRKKICSNCGRSHEGWEFIKALALYIATFSLDSEDAKELLRNLEFAE